MNSETLENGACEARKSGPLSCGRVIVQGAVSGETLPSERENRLAQGAAQFGLGKTDNPEVIAPTFRVVRGNIDAVREEVA